MYFTGNYFRNNCIEFISQADEKNCEKRDINRQIIEDNMAEIHNTLTSDLLRESPDVAQSNLGIGRKISSMYKGMTEEDRRKIRSEQLAQIEEAKVSNG